MKISLLSPNRSLTSALAAGSASLSRYGLAIVLLATLFKGMAWSLITPPWHAPDEPQHFLYAQSVERLQTWRVEPSKVVPEEAQILADLLQYDEVKWRGQPFDLSDPSGIAAKIALLDEPEVKRRNTVDEDRRLAEIQNFTGFHPPLYYMVVGAVQAPLEGASILVRILASRWLSILLGLITVSLAYVIGHELWPGRRAWPLLLAVLVSFHPMLTFSTSIISNEALEITLFSACLLVSLRVIKGGLTAKGAIILGCLVGLGLLTKISFLSIIPLLGLLFLWHTAMLLRRAGAERRLLLPWALVVVVSVLLGGWWYQAPVQSGGDVLVSSYGTIDRRPSVQPLSYLLHYNWLTIYEPLLKEYWGEFGWLNTPLPDSFRTPAIWLSAIAVWEVSWWLVRQSMSRSRAAAIHFAFSLLFTGLATVAFVAFYTYLDYRMARDLGGRFGIQGRYFLPPIIGQMIWLALGLTLPVPERLRSIWMWLSGAGMVMVNLFALFRVVGPRYYGTGELGLMLDRAAVLQPLDASTLQGISVAFVALSLMVLAALWSASASDRKIGCIAQEARLL